MAGLLSLRDPLNAAEDIAVIQCYWKADFTDQASSSRFKDYLKYYERQRAALTLGPKEFQLVERVAAKTHSALRDVARCLSKHRKSKLSVVRTEVQKLFPQHEADSEAIQSSIELSLRLWMTINIWSEDPELTVGNATSRAWTNPESSLIDFLTGQFIPSTTLVDAKECQMPTDFTACNLKDIGDLTIEWTECLAHHLRYDPQARKLYVYYFRECLYYHSKAAGEAIIGSGIVSPVYPEDVLRDAIRTLDLLFPQEDTTRAFLQSSKGKDFYDDPPIGMSRKLNLSRYTYWRNELHQLNQLFLTREQTSLRQALREKENSLQRWTLIGVIIFNIITIIFGIISSVTAGFSTRAFIQSLDVAREGLALRKMQGQPTTVTRCNCDLESVLMESRDRSRGRGG